MYNFKNNTERILYVIKTNSPVAIFEIANRTLLSYKTIEKITEKLEAEGKILIVRRRGFVNEYKIVG